MANDIFGFIALNSKKIKQDPKAGNSGISKVP